MNIQKYIQNTYFMLVSDYLSHFYFTRFDQLEIKQIPNRPVWKCDSHSQPTESCNVAKYCDYSDDTCLKFIFGGYVFSSMNLFFLFQVLTDTDHCYCVLLNAVGGAAFPCETPQQDSSHSENSANKTKVYSYVLVSIS